MYYSSVPNITVGNPYYFFDIFPSYMALFVTSRLLNFMQSSFLHLYILSCYKLLGKKNGQYKHIFKGKHSHEESSVIGMVLMLCGTGI